MKRSVAYGHVRRRHRKHNAGHGAKATAWTCLIPALAVTCLWLTTGSTSATAANSLKTALVGQQWSLGLTSGADFHQALVALQLYVPRTNNRPVSFYAFIPYAFTSDDAAEASLSGVGDAMLRATWNSDSSRWAVTAGLDLPTGKNPLSISEYIVSTRILASRVLDFYFKRPGEGLDLMASVAHTHPIGRNTVLGFGLGAFLKGEYDVANDIDGSLIKTAPGNRVHFNASLLAREHDRDPDWDWRANFVLQIAADSRLTQGAEEFDFSEGVQGTLELAYGRRLRRNDRLQLLAFFLSRGINRVDGQDLLAAEILGIGTRWVVELGAMYTRPISDVVDLGFGLTHAMYQVTNAEDINSRVTSFLLKATRPILPQAVLAAELRFGRGSTPWTIIGQPETWERRTLSGWSLGLSSQFFW